MPSESIVDYMKYGFPVEREAEGGYITIIEYTGPGAKIRRGRPRIGDKWGNYEGWVSKSETKPAESATDWLELTVEVFNTYADQSSTGDRQEGEPLSPTYERRWVPIERDLLEHPAFRVGGGGKYALAIDDVAAIEKWKTEENAERKNEYKYRNEEGGAYQTLSANAQMLAKGIQRGVEVWVDYAPVIRSTTIYVGGMPPQGECGQAMIPPAAAAPPTGWQWRKSADDAVKIGGESQSERVEEWEGAYKVLIDRDQIFWS